MRLLHTSDWHLGRTFHGRNLLGDQEQVLGALADLVAEHEVDAVLVSGDLYDRAVPSIDAIQLATRVLRRIADAGAQIIVSTGNHDSAPRLGAFTDFLSAGGLHIRAQPQTLHHPVLLTDDSGPVAVYGIPYLDPDVTRQVLDVPQAKGHAGVLAEAMRRIREDLSTREPGTRSVVLAHAFVLGGSVSESERWLDVSDAAAANAGDESLFDFRRGTVGSVPLAVFAGVDYVALGHLHRRQQLAPTVRYSGSPLPYSFSEAGSRKGCWLIDLDAGGVAEVRALDLPVVRPLTTLRGTLDEVLAGSGAYRDFYVAVELSDSIRPLEPMRRLAEVLPFVVKMEWSPPELSGAGRDQQASRRGLPDFELIDAFSSECRGTGLRDGEKTLVQQALSGVSPASASSAA